MSLHSSLKRSKSGGRHRNVLRREERLAKLTDEEKWSSEANSIFGLPKVRSIKPRVKKKAKKKDAEGEAAVAAGAAGAGAAPGAPGAPGAPAGAGAASAKGAGAGKAGAEAKSKGGAEARK